MEQKVFYFKQVLYHEIEDYLRLGWTVNPIGHASSYGIVMEWTCNCREIPPTLKDPHK